MQKRGQAKLICTADLSFTVLYLSSEVFILCHGSQTCMLTQKKPTIFTLITGNLKINSAQKGQYHGCIQIQC